MSVIVRVESRDASNKMNDINALSSINFP